MTHLPCNCLSDFNKKLEDHNTEIDVTFCFHRDGRPMTARPKISTSKIESRKRVGPVIASPTFCPFCGKAYEPQPAVAAPPSIRSRMVDASVRIEGMWPFPVWPAPAALGSVFEFADEDDMPAELRDLLTALPDHERDALYDGDHSDFQEAFEAMCVRATEQGLQGFVGIAANPRPRPFGGGGVDFSWGLYDTKVIFGATADAFLETATEWGEKRFHAAQAAAEKLANRDTPGSAEGGAA